MSDRATLEQFKELKLLADAINDPELDRALNIVVQCIKEPHVPPNKIADVITELSAIAAKFGVVKVWYKTFGKSGSDERMTKDVYFTLQDSLYHLIDALKYHVRAKESRF
jgi:hypothetical protein